MNYSKFAFTKRYKATFCDSKACSQSRDFCIFLSSGGIEQKKHMDKIQTCHALMKGEA